MILILLKQKTEFKKLSILHRALDKSSREFEQWQKKNEWGWDRWIKRKNRNTVMDPSYQILSKSKELFLDTKIIFSSEMHYFLMQGKFLWVESIFDMTYSVLHFFDSSNFFPLYKIFEIQICFYKEIFLFYILFFHPEKFEFTSSIL